MITLIEVSAAIDKISRVFPTPLRAQANPEAFVRTWHEVLGRLTPMQLDGAVKQWLASEERFFPTPGKLLAIARLQFQDIERATDLGTQYRDWEQHGYKRHEGAIGHAPCPVCDAELGYYVVNAKTGLERLFVLHNAGRHHMAGVPFVGRAAQGTGGGAAEWAPPAVPAAQVLEPKTPAPAGAAA